MYIYIIYMIYIIYNIYIYDIYIYIKSSNGNRHELFCFSQARDIEALCCTLHVLSEGLRQLATSTKNKSLPTFPNHPPIRKL